MGYCCGVFLLFPSRPFVAFFCPGCQGLLTKQDWRLEPRSPEFRSASADPPLPFNIQTLLLSRRADSLRPIFSFQGLGYKLAGQCIEGGAGGRRADLSLVRTAIAGGGSLEVHLASHPRLALIGPKSLGLFQGPSFRISHSSQRSDRGLAPPSLPCDRARSAKPRDDAARPGGGGTLWLSLRLLLQACNGQSGANETRWHQVNEICGLPIPGL